MFQKYPEPIFFPSLSENNFVKSWLAMGDRRTIPLFFLLATLVCCSEKNNHTSNDSKISIAALTNQQDSTNNPSNELTAASETSSSRGDSLKYTSLNLNDKAAVLQHFFTRTINSTNEIIWVPEKKSSLPISDDGYCHTAIDSIIYYGNEKRSIILFSTYEMEKGEPINCHACAPTLSIALLTKDKNKWIVDTFLLNFTESGVFGNGPDKNVITIGENNYGLQLSLGNMAQGFITTYVMIYDLKHLNMIFDYNIYNSNEGAEPSENEFFKNESKIKFIPSGKEYFDIELSTKGTALNEKETKVISVTGKKLFHYNKASESYK
jgi:hypothetical protein